MIQDAIMKVETTDLDLFSEQEDLFCAASTKVFNTIRIDQTITNSAHRALQVCNAQAQLLLAQYQTERVDHMLSARQKAERIAFGLGEFDYEPGENRVNPFDEAALREAWQQGQEHARVNQRSQSLTRLQNKFWEDGVDTEDSRSQFELCALQLYALAATSGNPQQAERAKRLAMEMCRYHEGEAPSTRRQQEIDRFMACQAARLASELDF